MTLTASVSDLSGNAQRFDLEHRHFWANEQETHVAAEVRLAPRSGWLGALRVSTARESRTRHDSLVRLASNLQSWAPSGSLEIGRVLPAGLTLAVGAGFAQHAPWGAIPDPGTLSQAYRDWIAPELALYGTESSTFTRTVTLLWQAGSTLDVWARGTMASLSGQGGIGSLPSAPAGTRTRGTLEAGVTMRER